MVRVLLLIIGYCCGLFQTGYIYGKLHGIDIRTQGSGNSGATNSVRVFGKKAGVIVFLGDALKCFIPAILTVWIFKNIQPDHAYLYMMYIVLGATLGHNFPFYMNFKGGKGISCMGGIAAAYDWRFMLFCAVEVFSIMFATKYVSVASMVLSVTMFIFSLWAGQSGFFGLAQSVVMEYYIISFVISALAIWQHRANIKRLINGTENKIGSKKKA